MKTIIFYFVKNSNDVPSKIFWKENKNTLFLFKKDKIIFNSHFKEEKEEVKVYAEKLIFDKRLFKNLSTILKLAKHKAEHIAQEPIGREKIKKSIEGTISLEILKSSYENPQSIFHFTANLFIKILMGHKLDNGNKRVSLLFLISTLRYLGYHLNWSQGINQNYSHYKPEVEKIVEELENGYNKEDVNKVASWIKSCATIAIEWRANEKNYSN